MTVDIESLDIGTLCYLVGQGFNELVLARLRAEGFEDVKVSFGYVVQHLLKSEMTVTQLAGHMGITQQAASKRVREMLNAGVVEAVQGKDRRESRIALSPRGRAVVSRSRVIRGKLASEITAGVTSDALDATQRVLASAIRQMQMAQAVEQRNIKERD